MAFEAQFNNSLQMSETENLVVNYQNLLNSVFKSESIGDIKVLSSKIFGDEITQQVRTNFY
jgi:hypothetical protein